MVTCMRVLMYIMFGVFFVMLLENFIIIASMCHIMFNVCTIPIV